MKKLLNRNRSAGAVILFLFLLSLLMVVLIHANPGYERWIPAVNSFMLLEPEAVDEKSIDGYAGIQRTYTVTLPEARYPGTQIRFFLRHTYADFWIDDSSRADRPVELNTPHIGHTTGLYWMSIPVHTSLAGEKLHIVLTPVYREVLEEKPVFYYIDRDTLFTNIVFPLDRNLLILSIATATAGIYLILFSVTPKLSGDNRRNLFYMGSATICAGVWKLCGLPASLLLFDYLVIQKEIWYTGVLSYILMLVLSLRLQISLRSDSGNRVTRLIFYIAALTAILLVVLQFMGLFELYSVLVWYGIAMAFLHLIALFGRKPTLYEILWFLPFFITLGLDFIIFLLNRSQRNAPFFLLWMLINLFIRGFGFIRDDIEQERQLRFKEVELKESRIRAMMSEIRPHFIHNTLISIYMLCTEDPERAQEVIADFASYLQANFSAISATELTSFNKELEHTKSYIAIESILYEGKLTIEYDIQHTAFRLPPLTLQPIVENALYHGIKNRRGRGLITITGTREGENILLQVHDNGAGMSQERLEMLQNGIYQEKRGRFGLWNVHQRIRLYCGENYGLTFESVPGEGTTVTVKLPAEGVTPLQEKENKG